MHFFVHFSNPLPKNVSGYEKTRKIEVKRKVLRSDTAPCGATSSILVSEHLPVH